MLFQRLFKTHSREFIRCCFLRHFWNTNALLLNDQFDGQNTQQNHCWPQQPRQLDVVVVSQLAAVSQKLRPGNRSDKNSPRNVSSPSWDESNRPGNSVFPRGWDDHQVFLLVCLSTPPPLWDHGEDKIPLLATDGSVAGTGANYRGSDGPQTSVKLVRYVTEHVSDCVDLVRSGAERKGSGFGVFCCFL